jgi:uncharacterized protein YdaU (DUF1376 family)
MAEFPALPLWTDAYIGDCSHLTDAEHGVYLQILILLWRAPKQRIPNDPEWLARKFRRSIEECQKTVMPVVKEFCQTDGNWITQKRISKEFAYVSAKSKKQADRAKSRWNKDKGESRGNAARHQSGNAPTPTPTPTPTPREDRGSPPSPPATVVELRPPEPRGVAALKVEAVERKVKAGRLLEFRQAYPKREGSQSWPAAEKKYIALVASGVSESDMIEGARRYAEHLKATGSYGSRYVKQALTWLNQGGWNDEYLTGTGRRQQSDLMDALDARVREAKARRGDYPPGEGGDDWAGSQDAAPAPLRL